jgi:hypothetical protein
MSDFNKRKKQALEDLKINTEAAIKDNKIPFGEMAILSNYAISAQAILSARKDELEGRVILVNSDD